MRDELKKEYDLKLKQSLDELEEYKAQLTSNHKDSESKAVNQFQKQIADKERTIYQLCADKEQLEAKLKVEERTV